MNKAGMANRLQNCKLRGAAEAYREEVRIRIAREQGGSKRDRDTVSLAAWQEMWDVFRPIVERYEADKAAVKAAQNETVEPPAPQLIGLPKFSNDLLDPDYTETDPGKQLRDGLLWPIFEWMRVISDTPEGPVADIKAASKPPPNAVALFTLSTYALSGTDKRRELITRALAFATKSHDNVEPKDENQDEIVQPGGFLDEIK